MAFEHMSTDAVSLLALLLRIPTANTVTSNPSLLACH